MGEMKCTDMQIFQNHFKHQWCHQIIVKEPKFNLSLLQCSPVIYYSIRHNDLKEIATRVFEKQQLYVTHQLVF